MLWLIWGFGSSHWRRPHPTVEPPDRQPWGRSASLLRPHWGVPIIFWCLITEVIDIDSNFIEID